MTKNTISGPPVAAEPAGRDGGSLEGVVVVARGFAPCRPVETQDFTKAAEGDPRLREDLTGLAKAHSPSDLVALANALMASAQPARRDGPRPYPVSEAAEAAAKLWGARVKAARKQSGPRSQAARAIMTRAISAVAPLLPQGAGGEAQRDRARALINLYAESP
jgi:hypothetical protein